MKNPNYGKYALERILLPTFILKVPTSVDILIYTTKYKLTVPTPFCFVKLHKTNWEYLTTSNTHFHFLRQKL